MPKKQNNGKTKYAAPAVDGMLDILEYLANRKDFAGVSELSRELGISNHLAFRIMKRLEERGYAEADSSKGYQLNNRFFTLGMKLYSRFELRRRARPHLEKLSKDTGETCQVQVMRDGRMLAADTVTPRADFFLQVVPGSRLEIHPNAFGKAIVAFLPEGEAKEILPAKLVKLTPHTVTTKSAFFAELAETRKTGLAYDREEYNIGVFCVGAPVFDVTGQPVAGVGVTGLSSRFDKSMMRETEQLVLKCARDISMDIGYDGTNFRKWLSLSIS